MPLISQPHFMDREPYSSPYCDCSNALAAVQLNIRLLEEERTSGLRMDEDRDYFLEFIFPAKVAMMFLQAHENEAGAIEAMKALKNKELTEIAEILEAYDYEQFEF